MKAVITAGGRGTRLQPLTHTKNKHLLPIANKPIIFNAIEDVADAGITEILVNINAGDKELPAAVGDGSKWNVHITYQEQDKPMGLGHLLKMAKDYINGEDFVFYYGDNVFTGGLQEHLKKWKAAKTNFHLCLVKVPDPERFGVAVINGDHVITTVEKPQTFISDLAITGIQFYDNNIFEALEHINPTPPKAGRTIAEMDIPPANQWLIDHGFTSSYSIINGWWKDTGKPETLLDANRLILDSLDANNQGTLINSIVEGKVIIAKSAKITNSKLRGPIIIGENTQISDAYIGPNTSIYNNCKINAAEIENSIILGDVIIDNVKTRLDSSLVGWFAEITEVDERPRSTSLFIGDNSKIKL